MTGPAPLWSSSVSSVTDDAESASAEPAKPRTARRQKLAQAAGELPPDTWRLAWERVATLPLALAALVFLAAYGIPIAWPDVDKQVVRWCTVAMQVAWLTLLVDYEVRFLLARRKVEFVLGNLVDLLVLVLPMFHFLRMLRLVALLSILDRAGVRTLRGRVVSYAVAVTLLVYVSGALAVTQVERGAPGATIENLADGFWFSIVTMTTVGYGDYLPVTATGKVVAAVLMITGLAMLGTVTATLASFLTSKVATGGEKGATRDDVVALNKELAQLRTFLGDPDAKTPLGPPPKPPKVDRLAVAAEEDVRWVGRALHLPHTPGPWITLHKVRGTASLVAAGVALLFFLAGLTAVATGTTDEKPTQEQIDNTIAGMPSALAFYLLGTLLVGAIAVWVAVVAFRRADGPGWFWLLTVATTVIAYGTTTLTLLDQVSSTVLVSSLSVSFPFIAGVIMAMAFAQSRPPEPGTPEAAAAAAAAAEPPADAAPANEPAKAPPTS